MKNDRLWEILLNVTWHMAFAYVKIRQNTYIRRLRPQNISFMILCMTPWALDRV